MGYCAGTGERPSICRYLGVLWYSVVAAPAGTYFAIASRSASFFTLGARDRVRGATRLVSAIAVH